MNNIILAYCSDNTEITDQLAVKLSRAGIAFNQISDQPGDQPGQFASRVQSTDEPVLLIVTDNYLRNLNCMSDGLPMLQGLLRQHRATVVIANGIDAKGNPTPTLVERNLDALQYIHFWQEQYQQMLNRRTDVPPHEREAFEQDLGVFQELAQNIGEFIGGLRESFYFTWPQLSANHFTLFFQQFNLSHLHESYRMLARLDEDVPPIRGTTTSEKVAETPAYNGLLPATHAPTAEPARVEVLPVETPKQTESRGAPEPIPANTEQMVRDAWFWIEQGQTDRGLQLFELAIEQYPGNEHLRNEYLRALSQNTREAKPSTLPQATPAQAVAEPSESKKYDLMGEEALQKNDFLFAKYCWDRVAEMSPNYPGIYAKLGILTSEHLQDYKETAIHYLRLALDLDAQNADLHYRLATLLRDHQGRFEEAVKHLQQAVGLAPNNAGAWFDLAYASLQMGRNPEAFSHYQRAIALAPALRTEAYDQLYLAEPTQESAPKPEPTPAPEPTPPPQPAAATEPLPTPMAPYQREKLTVLITGATSGIGRATAEVFAREGHRLILTGRRAERLEETSKHLSGHYGAEVLTLTFDVSNLESVKNALENLPVGWQDVDMLINNAGGAKGFAPIHEGRFDHWETMIDANLKGLLYVTRLISPGMVKRRKGHILNIGSTAGKETYPNGNVYCATKFAVDALTRAMRMDLYTHNIRVSQVSPGHVEETEFALTRFDGDAEKAKIYMDFQPLKSSDVAEVIYFIATRPAHVNIQDVLMMGTQQASSMLIDRSGR